MSTVLLPDCEAVAIAYLLSDTDLGVLVDDRIYGDLPEGAEFPLCSIVRVGGQPFGGRPGGYLDKARLQISGWSELRDEAFAICASALGALHAIPQNQDTAVVGAVEDIIGPRQIPDPTSNHRYVAEVLMTAHSVLTGS